jgi:hypothetical protein
MSTTSFTECIDVHFAVNIKFASKRLPNSCEINTVAYRPIAVLRRIFEPKRDEVAGDWRKIHNEDLHNLYSSPNIMIKSRKMRWAGNEA